jgi:hypothetical protein
MNPEAIPLKEEERQRAEQHFASRFRRVIAENASQNCDETRRAIKAVQEAALWAESAIRTWRPARMGENGMFSCDDADQQPKQNLFPGWARVYD